MNEPYGEYYFQHCCGRPYARTPEWLAFFAEIADRIVRDIGPRTVLDAGCAMGFLVEALRERGVDAEGIDISEYAIERVHPSVRPYCRLASIVDPLPKHYDLIVCIEVLEHLPRADAVRAIQNFCRHTSDVLISSTPYDFSEPTHVNVQPPDYWAEAFAAEGCFRDVPFDASFITEWAVRFRRTSEPMARVIGNYERRLVHLEAENRARREQVKSQQDDLAAREQAAQALRTELEGRAQALSEMLGELAALREEAAHAAADAATLRDDAAHAAADAAALRRLLHDREEEAGRLRSALGEAERELRAAEDGRRQAADALAGAEAGVRRLGGQLEAAKAALDSRDVALRQRDAQLDDLRGRLAGAERHIWTIEDAVGWRVLTRLRAARLRLLPGGSAQDRVWRLALSFLRIWMDEGLSPALSRARVKMLGWVSPPRLPASAPAVTPPSGVVELTEAGPRDRVAAVTNPPALLPHHANADIVVCVHNALPDVRACLSSVIRYSRPPYRLLIVDDGSGPETAEHLASFAGAQGATLIRNNEPRGYTRAANQGLRAATGDFVVLLNSDTLVTAEWLDRLIACAESDPRIGLVGPLSNTASWQSIPEIFGADGQDWAENRLPAGLSAADMGRMVAYDSARLYPRIPFLNGFCLMLRRAAMDELGLLDEERFGDGYGEENDYCLRAAQAGWQIAVADDAYIFHAQSRSYSHERRKTLAARAERALAAKHGPRVISEGVFACRQHRVLAGIRARAGVMAERRGLIEDGRARWEGRRVAFLLMDAEPGGGGRVVFQEAAGMRRMGIDARIVSLARNRQGIQRAYPEARAPIVIVDERMLSAELSRHDAVVATYYGTVPWLDPLSPNGRGPRKAYYVQDFEPAFFPEGSREHRLARQSYTQFEDLVRVTKTEWNRSIVKEQIGAESVVVGPSVDLDLFRPRPRRDGDWPTRPLRIAAMVRPGTPRRQSELTMNVLRRHQRLHEETIEIIVFGCRADDPGFLRLPRDFAFRHEGILRAPALVWLLNEIDIFVDFSLWQAMGMTALESMACGAAVILPRRGGADSFAVHEESALLVDTESAEECWKALERLTMDEQLRAHLQRSAVVATCAYPPERAAHGILAALFDAAPA